MRSLERALHILDALEDAEGSINVTRLENARQLSRATVLRIMPFLESMGFGLCCSFYPSVNGFPFPTGEGEVLAAALSDEELKWLMDEMGERTLANGRRLTWDTLKAEINYIRRQDYSFSDGERVVGIFSIAAPLVDADVVTIVTVSVAGATERLIPKKIECLSIEVRAAAKAIARGMTAASGTIEWVMGFGRSQLLM